jgi:UDPglucose 6-dehydrogenase
MKIAIFGSGYVGLVTGTCFADVGNDVLCVDVDPRKAAMLQRGEIPIHEPGLDELVRRNGDSGRLRFNTDLAEGVAHGLFQFIAVGTPPDEDGSADLQHVRSVARSIDQYTGGVPGGGQQVHRAGRHRRRGAGDHRRRSRRTQSGCSLLGGL